MTNYQPGGKVTIEFNDGSMVKDATVRRPHYSTNAVRWFTFGDYTHHLIGVNGDLNPAVKRVVSYTPPKPEWDRPEVRVIQSQRLDPDESAVLAIRVGVTSFDRKPTKLTRPDKWVIKRGRRASGNLRFEPGAYTAEQLAKMGDWDVWAVAP